MEPHERDQILSDLTRILANQKVIQRDQQRAASRHETDMDALIHSVAHVCRTLDRIDEKLERLLPPPERRP